MLGEFIPPDDPRWQEALAGLPHDFYHLPEYVAFAARYEGGSATAFLAQEGEALLLVPLLLRELPAGLGAHPKWRDASSPYGYGSPLLSPATSAHQAHRLLQAFVRCSREAELVAVFLRFHPLLHSHLDAFGEHGAVIRHGRTVCIDLEVDQGRLWRATRENHRRGIVGLRQEGFGARLDHEGDWPAFAAVYAATMTRCQAEEFYFFSADYFRELRAALGSRLHLCAVVAPDERVAAAGLFTVVDGIVQYHLGGTAEDYLPQAPSKLMFDHVRDWAKATGQRVLHLGGGVGCRDDSLFRFKAGFSANTAEFHTCRMIVNHERYTRLSSRYREQRRQGEPLREDYFPLYRS